MDALRKTSLHPFMPVVLIAALALTLVGCGGSDERPGLATTTADEGTRASPGEQPREPALGPESGSESEAAREASPEDDSAGPETSELGGGDRELVTAAVGTYIDALNQHDGAAVCRAAEPGVIDLSELPRRRGGCAASVSASIGVPPKGGGPAWQSTTVRELNAVSLQDERARVTATVEHRFSDRRFVSVEEDVIYLDRSGDGGAWLLAQPSGSFYRAVGYAEPPLSSISPPPD